MAQVSELDNIRIKCLRIIANASSLLGTNGELDCPTTLGEEGRELSEYQLEEAIKRAVTIYRAALANVQSPFALVQPKE